MKRKTISLMLISCLVSAQTLLTPCFTVMAGAETLPCSCDEMTTTQTNHDDKDLKFWTDENIKLLTADEQKQLCELQEKIKKGESLSEDDKKLLFELRDAVFKAKLGDTKYEDFKKLIEKKKCGEKLTEEEENKLKCYFKELK